MTGIPTPRLAAPESLLGILSAWLQAWPSGFWPSSALPPLQVPSPRVHSHSPVRVLVVDDDPLSLTVMSAMLASRGLVPVLAADGAEAVALACELDFDLILMDLQMPILDGLGATSAIRHFESSSWRPAVPVIAYSSTTPGAGVLAMRGMNGSLSKPCDDLDLEDCLVQWCPAYHSAPAAAQVRERTGARAGAS